MFSTARHGPRSLRCPSVPGVRHAAGAGDPDLVGEILEAQGGVRLWQREGLVRLQAVDRFVTNEVMERFPRTALARCIVLLLTGQLDEARKQYADLAARRHGALEDAAEEDMDYLLDETNVRVMLNLYGCERLSSEEFRAAVADQARLATMDEVNPLTRGAAEHGLACTTTSRRNSTRRSTGPNAPSGTCRVPPTARCSPRPAGQFLHDLVAEVSGRGLRRT